MADSRLQIAARGQIQIYNYGKGIYSFWKQNPRKETMRYSRFEDVPVWKDAIAISVKLFLVTEDPAFRYKGDIANQIQRAGLSVSNNIAEGFERGTTQELLTFLYYARGSIGEVRSILYVIEQLPALQHVKAEAAELKVAAESISR